MQENDDYKNLITSIAMNKNKHHPILTDDKGILYRKITNGELGHSGAWTCHSQSANIIGKDYVGMLVAMPEGTLTIDKKIWSLRNIPFPHICVMSNAKHSCE